MTAQAVTQARMDVHELSAAERVRAVAASQLRPIVGEIDLKGRYPEEVLRQLGTAGAFAQHHEGLSRSGSIDLPSAIEAMAAIAEDCVSTAFCTWCQDACGWYLQNSENTSLRERMRGEIASGRQLGGTGLSNPMKMLSGIERLKLSGRRVNGGFEVSGILPWVSNVQNGHYFAVVFADADDERRALMALVRAGENGVELRHNARFMALEGTATRSATFKNAFIPDEAILADPAEPFARRIRPGFVLLQTGLSLGLTRASVAAMRELSNSAGGTNAFLANGPDEIEDRLGALEREIHRIAATPLETTPDYRKSVLSARLEAAELALAAAHSAMLYAGARGYVEGAAPNRRLREAYFIAILTPAIKHLRKDLSSL
jgi:alkylation response protein AidB-like acyl-CoA dehydrogenase